MYPLQGFCPHLKQFSPKPVFKVNRKLIIFNVVFSLIFVVPCFSYLFVLPGICRSDDGLMCLIFSIDTLFISVSIAMSYYLFFVLKLQKQEMNCWCQIFYYPEMYSLEKILLPSEIKKIKFRKLVAHICVLCVNALMGVLYFYFPYDDYPGHNFRKPFIFLCYSMQWYIVLELSQRINTIKNILNALKKSIILNISSITNDRLQNYCKLILVINSNVRMNMKYMAVVISLWISQSTIGLIFNIYVSIRLHNYNRGGLSNLETRSVALILEIIILLVIAEESVNKQVRR